MPAITLTFPPTAPVEDLIDKLLENQVIDTYHGLYDDSYIVYNPKYIKGNHLIALKNNLVASNLKEEDVKAFIESLTYGHEYFIIEALYTTEDDYSYRFHFTNDQDDQILRFFESAIIRQKVG